MTPSELNDAVRRLEELQESIAKRVAFKGPPTCNQCLDWNALVSDALALLKEQAALIAGMERDDKAATKLLRLGWLPCDICGEWCRQQFLPIHRCNAKHDDSKYTADGETK